MTIVEGVRTAVARYQNTAVSTINDDTILEFSDYNAIKVFDNNISDLLGFFVEIDYWQKKFTVRQITEIFEGYLKIIKEEL